MSSLKMLAEMEIMKRHIEALESRVAELEQKRGPGRPRKATAVTNGLINA